MLVQGSATAQADWDFGDRTAEIGSLARVGLLRLEEQAAGAGRSGRGQPQRGHHRDRRRHRTAALDRSPDRRGTAAAA